MPKTPAEFGGPLLEDEIRFYDQYGASPVQPGAMLYSDGYFYAQDQYGVFNLRQTAVESTGVTESTHRSLRQLIHFIDEGPTKGFTGPFTKQVLPTASAFPTTEIWKDGSNKTIVELTITRDNTKKPITEIWKMYDSDGTTVVEQVTDTYTYQGAFEILRTRTIDI